MVIKIHRTVKKNDITVGYTVKINNKKYPKGNRNFYFPLGGNKDIAMKEAIVEYLKDN
mgnify:CR=1 FL=1